ncbi:hypothetical protein IU459_32730 [Nocardia amamiensis]|uniref:Uncharacterized protein n=1 Tax=Nocardia amamiensis TaxID=404578 RepID=A0ABS0D0C8_9NOCA|nr:hypothetical protein [Nocardia amamiensis]MBF6302271.1 hypothetical protein [Nocardia amamiensis]
MTAKYVLSITPTEQGYATNPAWKLGTSISVYSREELERRLAAAKVAERAGEISAVSVRELTHAEQLEAERCRRLYVRRQQERARAQQRGHSRER